MEHETKDHLESEAGPLSVQTSANLTQAPPKQERASGSRGWKEFRSLRGDHLFRRVRNKGKPGRGPLVLLRWLPHRRPVLEVGIVVSKKVGKAVVRNTVRRRLREAMRRSSCPAAQVLIIATPEAAGASYAELVRSLGQAMRKSGLEWQPL